MNKFFKILIFLIIIGSFFIGYYLYRDYQENQNIELVEKNQIIQNLKEELALLEIKNNTFSKDEKNPKEMAQDFNEDYKIRKRILKKSDNIKGVYVTKLIANSSDSGAQKVLNKIKNLLKETELNAVVIDVKEADGFLISNTLKELIKELHNDDIWVIARMVCFRDNSLVDTNPNFYIKKEDGDFWTDHKGYYWLDPSSAQVQKHLIDLSYKVIDAGFDEIQYDYIRFPVDDEEIIYPFYEEKKQKRDIIREFALRVRNNLRDYKSDIILSVDLFGEVATRGYSLDIGQNIDDFVDTFDYISFMIYPSHYFGGFAVGKDFERGLPALYYPYESEKIKEVVSNHPYEVVSRSIFEAQDYISDYYSELELQPQCVGKNSFLYCSKAKIRPWLQDFDLKADSDREIKYDAEKVRAQIDASEESGAHGWLLWNPSNVYTKGALLTN